MNVYRDGEKEKEEIDVLRASATSSTGVENQSVGGEGDGTAFFLRPFFFLPNTLILTPRIKEASSSARLIGHNHAFHAWNYRRWTRDSIAAKFDRAARRDEERWKKKRRREREEDPFSDDSSSSFSLEKNARYRSTSCEKIENKDKSRAEKERERQKDRDRDSGKARRTLRTKDSREDKFYLLYRIEI